jgi:hypothetical protein
MNTKTETKHTPGPWRVSEGMTPDTLLVRDDEHGIAQVWAAYKPDGPLEVGTKEANARLIAAAPELLEALRYLLNTDNVATVHAKWGEGCNREEVDAMLKQARAAIAKAEGKE